ncbi:GM16222 [Drosophila sechellia]|uniref:GM16222 n=1 Tax=Drosophila sechellia TaxID=7238 RepID=B4IM76_DROSE|nr:GM16222 [Drosophila sechellia]
MAFAQIFIELCQSSRRNEKAASKDALRDAEEAKTAKEELQALSKEAERKVKALEAEVLQLTEDLASSAQHLAKLLTAERAELRKEVKTHIQQAQ